MATRLNFVPSDGNYRFTASLNAVGAAGTYTFDVRWNTREGGSWHLDMYDPNGILMVAGVRIVLNVPLGRRSTHPFFTHNSIVAIDNTTDNEEPGFDDLGTRVDVWHLTSTDMASLLVA